MTRYTVVWVEQAQYDLADAWLNAPDRARVTAAAFAVDQELSADAGTKGIEQSEGLRALVNSPLRVLFSVRDDDRVVEVLRVRHL